MKKLLYVFSIILVVACGSDDPVTPPTVEVPTNTVFVLNATGTVAEKSPEEAKKIIYGKWDLSEAQRLMANSCAFNFIEFTDDVYVMSFIVSGVNESISGAYVLNEDADGTVSSVDLKVDMEGEELTVATLTDIVVTETNGTLSATFNIVLNIPEGYEDYEICNGLDGEYECDKDEPMDESTTASADSNHTKIVRTWVFESKFQFNENSSDEWYLDPCFIQNDDDEEDTFIDGCTGSTEIKVSISAYGTYTITWNGSNQGVKTETDVWEWSDASQTAFYVDVEKETLISIDTLTETTAVFTEDDDVEEGTGDLITYTFSAN